MFPITCKVPESTSTPGVLVYTGGAIPITLIIPNPPSLMYCETMIGRSHPHRLLSLILVIIAPLVLLALDQCGHTWQPREDEQPVGLVKC